VTEVIPGQPSCPDCGAPANAGAKACARCGYRFVEDFVRPPHGYGARRTRRPRVAAVALIVAAVAVLGYAASLVARDAPDATDARARAGSATDGVPTSLDVLSSHPLSRRGVEHLLEARFASPRPGDSAVARCSALQPRPAHAIRRCRIRHPGGGISGVVVLTNPQGQEVLVDR
jgi:hypothetical protein